MSFISVGSDFAFTVAEEYGTSSSPVSSITSVTPNGDFLTAPILLPPNFLNQNYLLIEGAIRRSALAGAPVAITAMWGVSDTLPVGGQAICNISIPATVTQTWRTFGVVWGASNELCVSSFQAPGTQATSGFPTRAFNPALPLYLMPRISAGLDIGDIVDLVYYRISAYRRG